MKTRGFTLIELMVVMGIIGLLATLAMPGYQNFRVKSHNAATVSEIRLVNLVETSFYAEYSIYGGYTVADKTVNGTVNKTITSNGISHVLSIFNLNESVESMVKVDASGQNAIVAARDIGGDVIIAVELEQTLSLKQKPSSTLLVSGDVPSSTPSIDLSSWAAQ